MDSNELLLAISNLIDAKLEVYTKQVTEEIQSVRTDLGAEIQSVRTDLGAEIQSVRTDLGAEIQSVRTDLEKELRDIKMYQENVLLPRLQNIEASYLSTYKRYRESADKMEMAYADIKLVKQVVQKHSEVLQEHEKQLGELKEQMQKRA